MKFAGIGLSAVVLLSLGACVESGPSATPDGGTMELAELPEGLLATAAPNQDLTSVRIQADGCYWYRYVGPVETTYLPLRSRDGRPICAREQAEISPSI